MGKKKFQPELTRIKLTPEQAVLTCCASSVRAQVIGGQQCMSAPGCGVNAPDASSS